jgi:hypothetical protein
MQNYFKSGWVRLGMSKLVSSLSVAPCFHIAQTTGISLVLPSEECCILIYNLLYNSTSIQYCMTILAGILELLNTLEFRISIYVTII